MLTIPSAYHFVGMNTELIELLHEIARVLSKYGIRAYAVSGVVRDWLLGKQRTDIDIALPEGGKNVATS